MPDPLPKGRSGWKRRAPGRVINALLHRGEYDGRLPDDVYPTGWLERAEELEKPEPKDPTGTDEEA